MALPFDSSTRIRLGNQGEDHFNIERPCIIDRISIALTLGQDIYTLPSYVNSIRRMTYLGWKIYPLPHRDLRASYLSGTQQSRPYWYIFNNIGQQQIKLFPIPSLSVTQVNTNLWGQPDIINGFIIEFFRQSDYAVNSIPAFMRDRIRDNYANYRSFAMEGQYQNMKASKYYKDKYESISNIYVEMLDDLNNKPRNLVATDSAQRPYGYVPPPPILPVDRYGISVDEPSW